MNGSSKTGWQWRLLCRFVVICAISGCSPSHQNDSNPGSTTSPIAPGIVNRLGPKIEFVDVAESSGVTWIGRNGEEAKKSTLLQMAGTGCAIEDYDCDGKLDLFFAGGGEFGEGREILPLPFGLYRQFSPWNYISVAKEAGLNPIRHYNHGTYTADIDNDGFPDLLITGWGGLQLFQNHGDGTFEDITESAGLTDSLWSTAAGWGDFNRDHVLDLYVGHYTDWSFDNDPVCINPNSKQRNLCAPTDFEGLPCTVYLGNGDGTYRDASVELGIHEIGKVLGVVIADINGDLQPDLYVANDALPNHLYVSQPAGNYREVAIQYGVALGETGVSDGSMGVDLGDLDGDGKIDIWVANYEQQSFALYRNLGNELFTHASRPFGITAVGTLAVGFGTVIFDADGDGFSDIFCSNGHVWAPVPGVVSRQRPYLFRNDRGKKFLNIATESRGYLNELHLGRGAASGDLDGNGTPDLVVTHINERVAILRNDTPMLNWLEVKLVGRVSNRSAIGASVSIKTQHVTQIGLVKGGGSYLSTSDRTLNFGLGTASVIETLVVKWPSGKTTELETVSCGQKILLIEESGAP